MFHENGNEMKHRQPSKTIRIYDIEEVYYIKMTVGDVPDDQQTVCDNNICVIQKPEYVPRRGR